MAVCYGRISDEATDAPYVHLDYAYTEKIIGIGPDHSAHPEDGTLDDHWHRSLSEGEYTTHYKPIFEDHEDPGPRLLNIG